MTAVLLGILGSAQVAWADTAISTNWSGYVDTKPGSSFHMATAQWRQPAVHCQAGHAAYSAMWVGLGGFNYNSQALEQTGTEADCSVSGKPVLSAWYELLPADSQPIYMSVHPGDLMAASVTVTGSRVTFELDNLSRHQRFHHAFTWGYIDVSSADWIVEAPSECFNNNSCQTLPLANFGTAKFRSAGAETVTGLHGSIAYPGWSWTRIVLEPDGTRRFAAYNGSGPSAGAASPRALSGNGTSFSVGYLRVSVQSNPFLRSRAAGEGPGHLVHPTR